MKTSSLGAPLLRQMVGRCALLASVAACAGLCACVGSVIQVAENIEAAGNAREAKSGIAKMRAYVDKLQAAGDPLGDYYYALGNSDGWIKDASEPKAITALFEKAAAKGSMDAKILLAFQLAMGQDAPGSLDDLKHPNRNSNEWEQGLARLEPLLKQQCFARRLVLDDGIARAKYYVIALDVWPIFRDGYYRWSNDGARTFVKGDVVRQNQWQQFHKNCDVPKITYIPTS